MTDSNSFDAEDGKYGETFVEADSNQVPPTDVVTYNELRSCFELFRLCDNKNIDLHPEFQRDHVWQPARQTRFVDSLLKKLPIPSLCLALDFKTEKMIVIDGLQRLSTLVNLMSANSEFKLASLDDVDTRLSGKTSAAIRKQPELIARIENVSIPVTILRCDMSRPSHSEYVFTIFHRLNTGGMALNNQEIRNCIYQGDLNNLLRELDSAKNWVSFIVNNARFRGQEQILRFLSFSEALSDYDGRLSRFLNYFMEANKKMSSDKMNSMADLFRRTIAIASKAKHRPSTLVIREALLYSIGRNLELIENSVGFEIDEAIEQILGLPEFEAEVIQEGLAQKEKLISRLNSASDAVYEYAKSCG